MNALHPERWHALSDLLDQLLDLPEDEHTAFLKQVNQDNPSLYGQLLASLAANDTDHDFLRDLSDQHLQVLLHELDADKTDTGDQIGPYRLVRLLGRGGMGAVYLAERSDGVFRKQVALKLVRRGLVDDLLSRFTYERQILAGLDHPNIARLYDGGTTDDGRPYFVMEYVDGLTITDYCDQRRLTTKQRLVLFSTVCRAVQYAHANLVIHRDLKPSNILVTDEGTVKLLDFGIAKLLDEEAIDQTVPQTQAGQHLMTPEYASPEQIRGETITTATDVYQLGVLLYELLTGRRPYRLPSRVRFEVERAILEDEPERPSTAVRQINQSPQDASATPLTPEAVSAARSTSAERLWRQLGGDLDTIVLKALRKEPQRRYGSVEQLAADLRRHLKGLPVDARPDALGYRLRKFVGRHRVGMLTVLMMVLLAAGFTWGVIRERDRAQAEASKLAEVKAYLVGLFEVSNPWEEHDGGETTARALLERGVEKIEDLTEEPVVQAEMMYVLGEVYLQLGMYEEAQPLLEQSLDLRREVLGPRHEDVASSMNALASLLSNKGQYQEAEASYREALAIRKKLLGDDHLQVAESKNGLADALAERTYYEDGTYDEVETLRREAMAAYQKAYGTVHSKVAQMQSALGVVLSSKGQYDEAEVLYRQSLVMRRELFGEEHPAIASSLYNLGWAIAKKGNAEEAEPLIRQGVAMYRKTLGDNHPSAIHGLANLANFLQYHLGSHEEAETTYREALALRRQALGDNHPDVASTLSDLALNLGELEKYAEAEKAFREAIAVWRTAYGNEHRKAATTLNQMGVTLRKNGDYDKAIAAHREALPIYINFFGEEHARVAITIHLLAKAHWEKGDIDEAEARYREALTMYRNVYEESHINMVDTLTDLALLLQDKNESAEGEPLLREALAITQKQYGDDDLYTAQRTINLGRFLIEENRTQEAEELLQQPYVFLTETFTESRGPRTNKALQTLGACLTTLAKYSEAEPLLLEAHAFFIEEKTTKEIALTRRALADLYTAWGKPQQAAAYR